LGEVLLADPYLCGVGAVRCPFYDSFYAEIHLAIRWVSMLFGNILGPLIGALGKTIAGLLVAIYLRRFAIYILLAASIISFWAAWYNVWGYKIYEPNIFNWIPW